MEEREECERFGRMGRRGGVEVEKMESESESRTQARSRRRRNRNPFYVCKECQKLVPLSDFHKSSLDRYIYKCKECYLEARWAENLIRKNLPETEKRRLRANKARVAELKDQLRSGRLTWAQAAQVEGQIRRIRPGSVIPEYTCVSRDESGDQSGDESDTSSLSTSDYVYKWV